jgi:acetoin utilization deacetylase AcuC-like enzyme
MIQIAEEHAEGRLLSMLEGGYNLDGLKKAVKAHVKTLADHS